MILNERQVAQVYQSLFRMSPRETDIFMLHLLGPTPHTMAVYLWQYMGRPAFAPPARIEQEIRYLLEEIPPSSTKLTTGT